jgi:Fe-S cluster biosynthesis and repair protein YggX
MSRNVNCIHLKKTAEGLDYAPYPGDLGKRIYNEVSKEAWQLWMKHQTMLVNENRLNLADQRARDYLKRQMESHFFGGGAHRALQRVQCALFLHFKLRSRVGHV